MHRRAATGALGQTGGTCTWLRRDTSRRGLRHGSPCRIMTSEGREGWWCWVLIPSKSVVFWLVGKVGEPSAGWAGGWVGVWCVCLQKGGVLVPLRRGTLRRGLRRGSLGRIMASQSRGEGTLCFKIGWVVWVDGRAVGQLWLIGWYAFYASRRNLYLIIKGYIEEGGVCGMVVYAWIMKSDREGGWCHPLDHVAGWVAVRRLAGPVLYPPMRIPSPPPPFYIRSNPESNLKRAASRSN